MENSGSTSDLWATYKRITKPSKAQNIAFITTGDGEVVEDPDEISDRLFRKFFPSSQAYEQNRHYDIGEPPPPVSVAEAGKSFSGGRPFAAPGPDGLPKALISRAFRRIPEVFAALATRSLQLGFLPSNWQRSQVVCVPKKPNSRNSLALLRPISLLGTIAQGVHQIVAQRLVHFVETHQGLSNRQFGVRVGQGTSEALVSAVYFIERSLGNHMVTYGITLDVKAAFDSLRPSAVLDSLEQLRAPSYLLRWVQSFSRTKKLAWRLEAKAPGTACRLAPLKAVRFHLYSSSLASTRSWT